MAFNFAEAKRLVRRTVQDTMAVPAFYFSPSDPTTPVPIRARWHNKIDRFGDPETLGYAEIIQGIDRVIFVPEDTPGFTPQRLGKVTFPDYGVTFELGVREPNQGPLENIWLVSAV